MINLWIMLCVFLLMFLVLGLALLYAGSSRVFNAHNALVSVFILIPILFLLWSLVGFSLSFGESLTSYIPGLGKNLFELKTLLSFYQGSGLHSGLFFLFNFFFALIAAVIILGSTLERSSFAFNIFFSSLWLLLVYAPVARWVWADGGFLHALGTLDFAGGFVVHVTSGLSSLMLTTLVGKRLDFFNLRKKFNHGLITAGFAFIWIGWFGFNCGSVTTFDSEVMTTVFVNTFLSSLGGMLIWGLIDVSYTPHKLPFTSLGMGMISGLVAITPGALYVAPWGALLMGIVTGLICNYSARYMIKVMKVDDVAESFSTHGVGGAVGGLLTALLCRSEYLPLGKTSGEVLSANFKATLFIVAYSLILTWLIYKFLSLFLKPRVDKEIERTGLDLIYHGERVINS